MYIVSAIPFFKNWKDTSSGFVVQIGRQSASELNGGAGARALVHTPPEQAHLTVT